MHRLLICLFFLICTQGLAHCELANDEGAPSPVLLELLDFFCVHHDGSWQSIQEATEKKWLAHGKQVERWQIEAVANNCLEKTYDLFTLLGMTQTVSAQVSYYNYAAVLGAIVQVVRQRFWSLKQAWEQGTRFSTLVVLTGERSLDPHLESQETLINSELSPFPFRSGWHFEGKLPQTETEMMQLVFDQLDLPKEWRIMPVIFVNTPKPEGLTRPHTEHTLQHWLKQKPLTGSILMVSNQPFVCRQNELLSLLLPPNFFMETIGEGFSFETFKTFKNGTAILLAELAYRIKIYYHAMQSNCFPLLAAFSSIRPPYHLFSKAYPVYEINTQCLKYVESAQVQA